MLLVLASLAASLVACEVVARMVLPPVRLVRFEARSLPDRDYGTVAPMTAVDYGDLAIFGPRGRRLAPNARALLPVGVRNSEIVEIATNSLGLRAPELGAKGPDEFRVLVLGDSITMGSEVHVEELYTSWAEALVAGRSRTIRFVNGGVMSMDVSNTFYQLTELLGPVAPDVVVIQLYLNDALKASEFAAEVIPRWLGWSRFVLWAANRVDVWRQSMWTEVVGDDLDLDAWAETFVPYQRRVYGSDVETFERMAPDSRDAAAKDYGIGWSGRAWVQIAKIIDAAARFCREHNVEFVVMLAPVDLQVYGSSIDRVPQEYFSRMCRDLDLTCLDLLPPLRERRQTTGDKLLYDQCHLTPRGHELVARELVSFLDVNDLLPE